MKEDESVAKYTMLNCWDDNNKGDLGIMLATVNAVRSIDTRAEIIGVSSFDNDDPMFEKNHNILKKYVSQMCPAIYGTIGIKFRNVFYKSLPVKVAIMLLWMIRHSLLMIMPRSFAGREEHDGSCSTDGDVCHEHVIDLSQLGLGHFCKMFGIEPSRNYKIEWIDAKELVTPHRLDLIAKILYAEALDKGRNLKYARGLYTRIIEACTNGMFIESGQEKSKKCFQDYDNTFKQLMHDVQQQGLDASKSVVPVSEEGIIMDGSHRVALSAYYNRKVPIVRFSLSYPSMGAAFFSKRLLPQEDIELLLIRLCEWCRNIYCACLWPAAKGNEQRKLALNMIAGAGNSLYVKEITISYNGLKNLIPQIYVSKSWAGGIEDRFFSSLPKVDAVYGPEKLTVCLFTCADLEQVINLKNDIRKIFNIAENSIHITDYPEETLSLVKILLNDNSIDFLNKANPFKYKELNQNLSFFKEKVKASGFDIDDFVIDSSAVMGLYGIRQPSDIDYLTILSREQLDALDKNIFGNHEQELRWHESCKDELIYDPQNFFVYFDLKFVTLNVLRSFKAKRGEPKDKLDVESIDAYIHNEYGVGQWCRNARLLILRYFRNAAYSTIKRLGLYNTARRVYHFIKKLH